MTRSTPLFASIALNILLSLWLLNNYFYDEPFRVYVNLTLGQVYPFIVLTLGLGGGSSLGYFLLKRKHPEHSLSGKLSKTRFPRLPLSTGPTVLTSSGQQNKTVGSGGSLGQTQIPRQVAYAVPPPAPSPSKSSSQRTGSPSTLWGSSKPIVPSQTPPPQNQNLTTRPELPKTLPMPLPRSEPTPITSLQQWRPEPQAERKVDQPRPLQRPIFEPPQRQPAPMPPNQSNPVQSQPPSPQQAVPPIQRWQSPPVRPSTSQPSGAGFPPRPDYPVPQKWTPQPSTPQTQPQPQGPPGQQFRPSPQLQPQPQGNQSMRTGLPPFQTRPQQSPPGQRPPGPFQPSGAGPPPPSRELGPVGVPRPFRPEQDRSGNPQSTGVRPLTPQPWSPTPQTPSSGGQERQSQPRPQPSSSQELKPSVTPTSEQSKTEQKESGGGEPGPGSEMDWDTALDTILKTLRKDRIRDDQ